MSFTATGRVSEQAVHDKDAWTLDRVNGQRKKSEDDALYSNLVFGRETADRKIPSQGAWVSCQLVTVMMTISMMTFRHSNCR